MAFYELSEFYVVFFLEWQSKIGNDRLRSGNRGGKISTLFRKLIATEGLVLIMQGLVAF